MNRLSEASWSVQNVALNMAVPQIVLDTNVLVAGLRSSQGASFRLLSRLDDGLFEINLSVPLVFEYEDVLSREIVRLTLDEVQAVIDYLCTIGNHHRVYFLWRPYLPDPKDEMVLELAVAAGCEIIVSVNKADFQGVDEFGIEVLQPVEFLQRIGEVK